MGRRLLMGFGVLAGLAMLVAACSSPSGTTSMERLPTPTPTATATLAPASPTPRFHEPDEIPEPPDADLVDLALRFRGIAPGTPLLAPDPGDEIPSPGRIDTFSVVNLNEEFPYDVRAELRYVSPHAYWYFDVDSDVDTSDLKAIAARFEDEVYGTVTATMGTEWGPDPSPGQRIVLLHTPIEGAAAYYSSKDDFSTAVHPGSNERKILYIGTALRPGSESYYGTVAHELQHAIHQRADPTEETWVNEGMAEVAGNLTGRPLTFARSYLLAPNSSVVNWARRPKSVAPNYGGASLFLFYLLSHYGGREGARALLEEPADGITGVEAYLRNGQQGVTFDQAFEDWAVANLLDLDNGVYSFPDLDIRPPAVAALNEDGSMLSVPQYGVAYVKIDGDRVLFEGGESVGIVLHEEGCWWSNAGDSIDTTLTRAFDLTEVSKATLELRLWYNIEKSWDYAYVTVSTDGGSTWRIVAGGLASPADPLGNAFGPGYTGASDGWVWDSVDLSAFAGSEIFVRLEYVTDEATTADGLCVSGLRIPELGYEYEASSGPGEWQAKGFFRVLRPLRQHFSVQVVAWDDGLRNVAVQGLLLDQQNRGKLDLQDLRERFEEIVAVVVPMTPKARQEATFHIKVE